MTNERTIAARRAARSALQLRRSLAIPRELPINVYDVASAVGVDVRFTNSPSLEGMFCKDPGPRIFLPCSPHRPRGRVAFTCGHELGHHQLGHGTQVDEYSEGDPKDKRRDLNEISADTFSATILMPRQAVLGCFLRRGVEPTGATPLELLCIANELGVGYETLLGHMQFPLEIVPASFVKDRKKVSPKQIRADFAGDLECKKLFIVDKCWSEVPIDVEVNEMLALPISSDWRSLPLDPIDTRDDWTFLCPVSPGMATVELDSTIRTIRISREGYVGPYKHKFLEDPE